MSTPRPHVDDAPGLTWRKLRTNWEARWKARTDLIDRGYLPKSVRLWSGSELDETECARIADRCRRLQDEMLTWSRSEGTRPAITYAGTLRSLITFYQRDPDSTYHKLRFRTRRNYDFLLDRIEREHGDVLVADIRARVLIGWHKEWSSAGRIAMGHGLISMLRTLFAFGATMVEDPECERLCGVMHKMKFPMARPRVETITAAQAIAVRSTACAWGYFSVALAQAFQFDLMLRQKDVIGEVVPLSEPGTSDVILRGRQKWLRGLRWEEIDQNMILRHTTSKKGKDIEVNLTLAPMVMEELRNSAYETEVMAYGAKAIMAGAADHVRPPEVVTRDLLPASGPVIICELTAEPWTDFGFGRRWRKIARAAGVPDHVKNMDSRAGAISEATNAGAPLEHVRHAATHSDTKMTQRYSRDAVGKVENVMQLRVQHRNKK